MALTVGRAVLLISALLVGTNVREGDACSQYTRCSDCITQDPTCAWCNHLPTFLTYSANTTDLSPAPFCGTREDLISRLGCPAGNIINPQSTPDFIEPDPVEGSPPQVSPSFAELNLRPGVPGVFNITVTPAASFSVDMYMLMDLTRTMEQDLNSLKRFAGDLVARMQELTNEFRIGYGSFVDKAVPPFSDSFNPDFPCALDAELFGIDRSTCDPTYSFRHRLDLTSNATAFEVQVNQSILSASFDAPEAILDAILQIAVCEERVGWRPQGQSRRLIFALTDGDYHYALDGKLAGITDRPDGQCHLDDSGEYDYGGRHDYPSSAYIAEVLNENSIIPIFAVENNVRNVYDQLQDEIRSAFVATRTANSENLLELVVDQYRELSSTVVPVVSGLDNSPVSISIVPVDNCSPGSLRPGSTDTCIHINATNSVSYTISLTASPEACLDPDLVVPARIQFVGFGQVDLNISFLCDCGCEQSAEEDSAECEGAGTLECSTCQCPESLTGPQCTCPTSTGAVQGCRAEPLDPVCNRRGMCVCGECECDPVDPSDSSVRYQGEFCQYDPTDCPVARDENGMFAPCANHGNCINGECVCYSNYTGIACECTTDTASCLDPLNEGSGVCSGEGRCVCGLCLCNDYSQRHGLYCEECGPCRTSCSKINPCVACNITRGKGCDEDDECGRIVLLDQKAPVGNFKTCSVVENGCEVRYQVHQLVTGDEDMITVYFNRNQSDAKTLRSDPDDCRPQLLIWPIPVGIILGILLIGLITIIVWRCLTYAAEYFEYREWLKNVREETNRSEQNPLFVDPNAKYPNPRYRQRLAPSDQPPPQEQSTSS